MTGQPLWLDEPGVAELECPGPEGRLQTHIAVTRSSSLCNPQLVRLSRTLHVAPTSQEQRTIPIACPSRSHQGSVTRPARSQVWVSASPSAGEDQVALSLPTIRRSRAREKRASPLASFLEEIHYPHEVRRLAPSGRRGTGHRVQI
jgi:hypothetical protein